MRYLALIKHLRQGAWLVVILCLTSGLFAKEAAVSVSKVSFNNNVLPYRWNNMVIELQANRSPASGENQARYVERIKVKVTIAYGKGNDEMDFGFYSSEATLITLEVGKRKEIAFWMPYSVVQRDNLSKVPNYWLVELEVDGKSIRPGKKRGARSSNFKSIESINYFKQQANDRASDNKGIFVPTYLSPNPYIDEREPPAFIRE